MFTDIANEFQNITKFELLQYFIDYRDFLQDDYASVHEIGRASCRERV